MVFNSYIFILLFLPITVVGYHIINQKSRFVLARLFLLGMSLWFYCFAEIKSLPILLCSLIINYALATFLLSSKYLPKSSVIHKKGGRIGVLTLGIILNIAALLYFRYLIFLEISVNLLFHTSFTYVNVLVPLGISFITFSQISYLVDTYRDETLYYPFLDYALYVAFFPKVTVGPIALSSELIPQFRDSLRKKVNYDNLAKGLYALAFGFAKKLLIADHLAPAADWGYRNISTLGTTNAAFVMLAYTMQIYFDFSGCCDIATGICLMLNIELPVNFDSPYRAVSIDDFWKRWHITLTRFFRNYVYIPLGGNRKGAFRKYLNIMIIFALSGLWHGASVTFILWGILHGVGSCLSKLFANVSAKLPKSVRFPGTFLFVNIAWIFFRAPDIQSALDFMKQLVSMKFTALDQMLVVNATPAECEFIQWTIQQFNPRMPYYSGAFMIILLLVFACFASIFMKNTHERLKEFTICRKNVLITVVLLSLSILAMSEVSAFLYVNF